MKMHQTASFAKPTHGIFSP